MYACRMPSTTQHRPSQVRPCRMPSARHKPFQAHACSMPNARHTPSRSLPSLPRATSALTRPQSLATSSRRPRTAAEKRHATWAERAWSKEEMSDLVDGVQMHGVDGSFETICQDRNLKYLFQQRRTAMDCQIRYALTSVQGCILNLFIRMARAFIHSITQLFLLGGSY